MERPGVDLMRAQVLIGEETKAAGDIIEAICTYCGCAGVR